MIRGVQGHNVGVVDLEQNLFFGVEVHKLVLLQYFLFAHDLESVDLVSASELDQFDPSEGAVSQRSQHLQVVALQLSQDLLAVLFESVQLRLLHRYNYYTTIPPIIISLYSHRYANQISTLTLLISILIEVEISPMIIMQDCSI